MGLQGTLDFELSDVLRVLASRRQTGCLVLRSERGEARVWLDKGRLAGVHAPGLPDADLGAGLFEVLRAHDGSFVFEAGSDLPSGAEPVDMEPQLAAAETQVLEWREIERIVPSLDAWVSLTPELEGEEITLDADTWRVIAMIACGLSVGELGRVIGLAEVPVSRLVRDLVQLGVGTVSDRPAEPAPRRSAAAVDHAVDHAPAASNGASKPGDPLFNRGAAGSSDLDQTEADDVARQIALLSPRAARAVRTAVAAETPAERAAARHAVEDGDDTMNRGLLVKFLSTVKR